jgi:AcrR family transcriptional regulator
MPRGWSERERATIQDRLLAAGRDLFATHGIRKTSVEDLTRAAGISKGAFYQFYESKEALFFEIIGRFELEFRQMLLAGLARPGASGRDNVRRVLARAFAEWRSNPLFTRFGRADYEYLIRGLPSEAVESAARSDEDFAAELIAAWQQAGVRIARDSQQVARLMRALFFVSLHEADFGMPGFEPTMGILIDLVAGYLVGDLDTRLELQP